MTATQEHRRNGVVYGAKAMATPAMGGDPVEVTCPSGDVYLVKRPDITDLAASGILAEQDLMSQYVDEKLIKRGKGKGGKKPNPDALPDGESLARMMMATDKLLPVVIVEPRTLCHIEECGKDERGKPVTRRIPIVERRPGYLYTDQIGLMDKMHLVEWLRPEAGEDERFRVEPPRPVAGLGDGKGVRRKGKRARRSGR